MKGIVLAGGTSSRLSPLTAVTNKRLLPVGKYPMVFHPIARLKQAGIKDILVVTGRDHMGDVMELLGSGPWKLKTGIAGLQDLPPSLSLKSISRVTSVMSV
jgi:dTDP-glucose pyrophosphorylase